MADDSGTHLRSAGDPDGAVPLEEIPLHSTNLLTVLDGDGTVRYESPAIERVFGFDQDELVDEPVAEYFHPDDRGDVVEAFETVVASDGHTVETVEYRHRRADGSYTWVESVASANPTPGGYYVVNTRDISDRKRRERMLKRANERLDAFVSVVSHDLRNPLSVAQGYLELAEEEAPTEHHEPVENALTRMETLISELLADARDRDRTTDVEPVDLAALGETCWRTVETADASLAIEVGRTIRADRSRLRQLLENLYRNAVEHGSTSPPSQPQEDGGDEVAVTLGSLPAGFYVEDDGGGIPADERDRVFDVGYSTASNGTGFGLDIVQQVADAHGWGLRLTDGTAGGARFEITGVEFAEE